MVAAPAVPVIVTSLTFTSIAAIIVLSRLYTRVVILKNAGADDYLMVVALAASIGFLIVVMFQIRYGLGEHFADIPPAHIPKFLQCLWATIPVYNLALVMCKLSIICQYMRIFTAPNVAKLCKIMIGILIVYGCWTVIGSTFMCIPVAFFWNTEIKGGRCMNKLAFWFSNAALNITTDIMIFAIPVPLLRQLQLPKKQKIGLMFVFAFGAFVCVTSIIRLKSLYEISVSVDTSVDGVNTAIWSGIEINVAIGCASLPAIKPLIGKVFPRLLSNGSSKNRSNMYPLSGNGGGSHHMDTLRSKGMPEPQLNHQKQRSRSEQDHNTSDFKVTVQQTVYQQSDDINRSNSREGSERSLVDWKAEVYCEEPRAKLPHDHV